MKMADPLHPEELGDEIGLEEERHPGPPVAAARALALPAVVAGLLRLPRD